MDPVAEIKRLYYGASKATIQKDLDRAIELLKTLPTEDDRQRAAVYMDGLSQMRSEWKASAPTPRSSSAPPRGAGPARSGRSTSRERRGR